ncbi:Tat pathway signal protein [Massilia eurypsychrophila]|uniref:Tat pathway signal protein n=1 Tax=Massilia eurypsychrophila TaxID=1485217 RepID=A0A2G8T7P6_9BURK|nr:DUF2271 domain-containing protein [Massilia eurypsychrophila]PIL42024.1 Tat pathway signal protein [Massilia eurypsychrophila]
MKNMITSACVAGALVLPALGYARPVVLTTQLNSYGGNGAYLAFYVTDAAGKYTKTLWVSGTKAKYYKHLGDWARGSGLNVREFDGVSGASVGSGKSLTVKVELADALIDAGYEIRIDSAVEDGRDNPADARAPLTKQGAGKPVKGRGYVKSFTYNM